jgi:DNA helicase-2/ATP-dependent DNA helicase PcrA
MEEYFWTEYDFSLLYQQTESFKASKRIDSQKLIYVACSRARNNLICVKVLTDDEVSPFLQLFPQAEFINGNKD